MIFNASAFLATQLQQSINGDENGQVETDETENWNGKMKAETEKLKAETEKLKYGNARELPTKQKKNI